MDNTNNTHHIVLTIAELTLLLVTSFLTGCATVEAHRGRQMIGLTSPVFHRVI